MTKKKTSTDENIGFVDFIEKQDDKTSKQRSGGSDSGFELISFLEKESLRLTKTLTFIEDKVFSLKKYSQSEALLNIEALRKSELQKKVLAQLTARDSIATKHIFELLKLHFNH